jgi:hypothetical protein
VCEFTKFEGESPLRRNSSLAAATMRSADMSPILALLAALAVNVGTFYSLPGPPEKLMQPFNVLESSSLLTDACANPHGSTDEAGSCRLCQTG